MGSEEYEDWYEQHEELCTKNHEGSAGKMEVDAIIDMFERSEEIHGVKYLNYIGDGDSKTFANILKSNPYGDDFPVTKSECVGHVQKRMGTRLRNIKKTNKLGGKGQVDRWCNQKINNLLRPGNKEKCKFCGEHEKGYNVDTGSLLFDRQKAQTWKLPRS